MCVTKKFVRNYERSYVYNIYINYTRYIDSLIRTAVVAQLYSYIYT